jgi:hypothetical protein
LRRFGRKYHDFYHFYEDGYSYSYGYRADDHDEE